MPKIETIGVDWIIDEVENMPDHVVHVRPSDFNEENRYLPESVTSIPGFIRYDAGYVETFGITCIFTVISYYRSYFWRRFFNAGIHNFIHNSVKRFLNT